MEGITRGYRKSNKNLGDPRRSFGSACRYVYQPNQGASAAKNTGIQLAQGQYLSFNDADDLWAANKLSLQLRTFAANPQLDMVFGYVQQFHSPELSDAFKRRVHCPKEPMLSRSFNTALIKKESFLSVGFFLLEWTLGEGVDWTSRALQKNCLYEVLPDVLSFRRLHEHNQGMHRRHHYVDYLKIAKANLDLRRLKKETHASS